MNTYGTPETPPLPVLRRLGPAVGLFFLAPLVAEFLLGDLPINMLGVLVILAPLYGGGALLIREFVRRSGRGWPSIFVLAFSYAVLEEAFTTQTLFNPNYLGLNLHLLAPAYVSALGIGVWWTIFVLTLHTVWSISTSVGLAESLVPERATRPWLGRVGLGVVSILFVLAAVASTRYAVEHDRYHFVASKAQFLSAAIICVLAIGTAFLLPKRRVSARASGYLPGPWLVGCVALAAGSIFLLIPNKWGWFAVALYLILDVLVITLIVPWSHRLVWNSRHRLALAGGAALAYAWHAFIQNPAVGKAGVIDRVGNGLFFVGLVIILAMASRRTNAWEERSGLHPGSVTT